MPGATVVPMAPGEVEVRDAGLRFHLPAVREQLARSKRERWALVLGGSASALWWATFTALAPMAQRVPSGAWGAAYWPAMLGLLGLGGAAIVVAVERAAGRRAAIAIALLLASPLPLSLGLIVADASALQAVPSRGFAHTQFVVRPFFNSFEGWHRRYAYRPEIELMTGLVGFALSGLVVLPITVFVVRRLPLAFLRLAPWLVRGLGACAALLVAGGAARAFLRPSVADFPARSVEVATAGGSAPRQDCPACGRERVPCCKLNVGNTGCIRDYGDTLYTEPLGPFVLGRACHGGAKCRLELALPTEGTETNRLIGDTTDLDVVVDLSTPVTLRRSPEHGIHWLFASSVPVAFAGAPDEPPCRSAPRSLACRIDARVSAKSLRGLVGPPRAA